MTHAPDHALFRLGEHADSALWRNPVLIGTPETLAALAGQLAISHMLPPQVGCLVVHGHSVEVNEDIAGLAVLGQADHVAELHARQPFSCAIVSLPASEQAVTLRLRESLRSLGVPERFVPTLGDLLARAPALQTQQSSASINYAELVGRPPFGMDRHLVRPALEAKRVLITGAGGSIGSELARIVATFHPSLLILMERSENALFEIDRHLARRFPDVPRKAILHDVVDEQATLRQLTTLKPHAVFHAAAHKHVPLMEDHPAHAITNNVFGTKSIADASAAVGAERFVFVSTDKAVNPSSTMGATKRLAEMYVQWLAGQQSDSQARHHPAHASMAASGGSRTPTTYAVVRFGNVLGSACSVLPIWSQQLSEGGPITVTDPRMTRYFMTIPEAASLVIQAGSLPAPRGRAMVYVLDMGEPLRILDLARRFVQMHGYAPRVRGLSELPEGVTSATDEDRPVFDITLTGARPGEKLHEELAYAAETLRPTACPGVLGLDDPQRVGDDSVLGAMPAMIADLSAARSAADPGLAKAALRRCLPADSLVVPVAGPVHTPNMSVPRTSAA